MHTHFEIGPVLLIRDSCRKYETKTKRTGCEACGTKSTTKYCASCAAPITEYTHIELRDYTLDHFFEDNEDEDEDSFMCGEYSTVARRKDGSRWTRYVPNSFDCNGCISVDEDVAFLKLDALNPEQYISEMEQDPLIIKIKKAFGDDNVWISYGISAVTM